MALTTGRTVAIGATIDAQSVLFSLRRAIQGVLDGADKAIKLDMADDHYWKQAELHINTALELSSADDKDAELLKAKRNLMEGMNIDFSSLACEDVRKHIVPLLQSVDGAIETFRALNSKLEASR